MNLLEDINESLGTNQNPGDSELNCLKFSWEGIGLAIGRLWV